MSKEDFEQFELKTFAGYLSADAEVKYFESGKNKVTFSIPLSYAKDSETFWLKCEIWNKEEFAELKKGTQVLVQGYLVDSEYNDKIYTTLKAQNIIVL